MLPTMQMWHLRVACLCCHPANRAASARRYIANQPRRPGISKAGLLQARRADTSSAGDVSPMALDLGLHLVRSPRLSRNLLLIASAIQPKGGTTNLNHVPLGVALQAFESHPSNSGASQISIRCLPPRVSLCHLASAWQSPFSPGKEIVQLSK